MEATEASPPPVDVATRIRVVRGRRVLVDADLAALHGVRTRRLNEAVKRNFSRFPEDFAFRVNVLEARLLMSQFATSKKGRGGRRKAPLVFTEHGALMVASVLNSRAIRALIAPPAPASRQIGFTTPSI
jgi:hypothetical protein